MPKSSAASSFPSGTTTIETDCKRILECRVRIFRSSFQVKTSEIRQGLIWESQWTRKALPHLPLHARAWQPPPLSATRRMRRWTSSEAVVTRGALSPAQSSHQDCMFFRLMLWAVRLHMWRLDDGSFDTHMRPEGATLAPICESMCTTSGICTLHVFSDNPSLPMRTEYSLLQP